MNKKKPVILVDLDDTLNNFSKAYWETYNNLYNDTKDYRLVDDWDLQNSVRDGIDAYSLLKHPGLFRNIEVKKEARSFIKGLLNKYEVFFVTDSPSGTGSLHSDKVSFSNPADDKREWIAENFPEIPLSNTIICSCKWMIQGDILIDDKPSTFEKFQELGRDIILIDMPYNRHINTKYRAHSLSEAEKLVEEILVSKNKK